MTFYELSEHVWDQLRARRTAARGERACKAKAPVEARARLDQRAPSIPVKEPLAATWEEWVQQGKMVEKVEMVVLDRVEWEVGRRKRRLLRHVL